MKENRMDIRAVEEKNRYTREEETLNSQKQLYKLSQFRDTETRVYEKPNEDLYGDRYARRKSLSALGDDEEQPKILFRGASDARREDQALKNRLQRLEFEQKVQEERPLTPRKTNVPKSQETAKLNPRNNTDFLSRNRVKAQSMLPPDEKKEIVYEKHRNFGNVPNYIENRKAKWQEQKDEIERSRPDPNCPRGMKLMPEEERKSTLQVLESSRIEAHKQLNNMPFIVETPSAKKKVAELEAKLREIENAISLFSKPKVYIAINE
jgi:hypothetical protein